MDYRKRYKEHYKIDFDSRFDIHHLDGNHYNNKIENLLLLPADLHKKYHYGLYDIGNIFKFSKITGDGLTYQKDFIIKLKEFYETLKQCNNWYDYKMYLDRKIKFNPIIKEMEEKICQKE